MESNGLEFKGWMATHDVTQADLCKLLDLTPQSINMKVNGKQDFSLEQIRKICLKYHISADIFLSQKLQNCN